MSRLKWVLNESISFLFSVVLCFSLSLIEHKAYLHLYRFKWVLLKELVWKSKLRVNKRLGVDTKTLLGYIEISGVKWGSGSIGSVVVIRWVEGKDE